MFSKKGLISERIPLSAEALEAKKPPPPEEIVGALHDTVHRDIGRFRIARVVRNNRNVPRSNVTN